MVRVLSNNVGFFDVVRAGTLLGREWDGHGGRRWHHHIGHSGKRSSFKLTQSISHPSPKQGRYIGPGQIGFAKPVANPANQTVTFHYYDRDGTPAGQHTLGIRFLTFSADGWPVISAPP
jgi:hypothetical protein